MAAKKAIKKAVKKPTKKTAKKPVRAQAPTPTPQVVTVEPVTEVFTTRPQTTETVTINPGSVLLFTNGTNRGVVPTNGETLQTFAVRAAQNYGIRTFSVYVDGQKVDSSQGNMDLTRVAKVEIVAKDSRG